MYIVYWLHLEKHTDIHSQGYVGITRNFSERMKNHFKNKRKTALTDAIKSYGKENIKQTILHDGLSLQEALLIEKDLRPIQGVGWNLQSGGEIGVESSWFKIEENKKKHREATSIRVREWIEQNDSQNKRSERAKKSWRKNRLSYEGFCTGSKNPRALLDEEQVKEIKYTLIPSGLSNREIANKYNVRIHMIQFIRSGKNWSYI